MTTPIWFGQARGADLSALATVDFSQDDEDLPPLSFLDFLRQKLFQWPTDTAAGILGWLSLCGPLLAAAGLGLGVDWRWTALLLAAAAAWTIVCIRAALLARSPEAPAWAIGLVDFLVSAGRLIVVIAAIVTIVVIVLMVSSAAGAFRASRHQ